MRTSLRIRAVRDGRDLLERDPVLRRIVEVIVREIDPDRIILFGSRARGDYKEGSDYDILVLKEGIGQRERGEIETKIRLALLDTVMPVVDVDVVVQSVERFRILQNVRFTVYHEVGQEGVVLYDKRGSEEVVDVR